MPWLCYMYVSINALYKMQAMACMCMWHMSERLLMGVFWIAGSQPAV